MLTRRTFLAVTGASMLTLYLVGENGQRTAVAAVPVDAMPAGDIPQFTDPLLIPPVMSPAGRVTLTGGKNADYYEISMRQFEQQILPAGHPPTTVWGYGPVSAPRRGSAIHNAPSLTIEGQWQRPIRIRWVNELVDENGAYLPHLLPVDPTLHWANPEKLPRADGREDTDQRPAMAGRTYVPLEEYTGAPDTYSLYTGPVPIVTHVHGAVGIGDESDGYPETWYLPNAMNLPTGIARHGRWYEYFKTLAESRFGASWNHGYLVAHYPNDNRASTLWYHDHALGMTRLNVYAGPAGFYILRGGPGGDDAVLDSRDGTQAVLPGPAPRAGDKGNKRYREIPIVVQDRSFTSGGQLFYPDTRAFFDSLGDPDGDGTIDPQAYIPYTEISPAWNPEFFGDTLIVNGRTWPYLDVEQARYRFRVLNGCQSRFLILDFSGIPGVSVWQIGTDGGLMSAPFDVTGNAGNRLLVSPAERVDLIVDFAAVPSGNHVLRNVGPDEPFGGGEPGADFEVASPATTGRVLQFRVTPAGKADPSTPARFLTLPALPAQPAPTLTRRVALIENMTSGEEEAPIAALLGTIDGDPALGPVPATAHGWGDAVAVNPAPGSTEIWEIYNTTGDAHPIHLHELVFQVVQRQDIEVGEAEDAAGPTVRIAPGSSPTPAAPWEAGHKDTVTAYPGQVTRIQATFGTGGRYVWHCHILEHEDNEMMLPLHVGPIPDDAPKPVPMTSG